jgi:hypothetical protein
VKRAEQISRHDHTLSRRYLKRLVNRSIRRAAKRDPEDAPKKPRFLGYTL